MPEKFRMSGKGYIAGSILLMLLAQAVTALPQIPETYFGQAWLGGSPAPSGTLVQVQSASGDVFSTTVYDTSGSYTLDVLIDDTETAADEGASVGESLTWSVNGVTATSPAPGSDTASPGGVNSGFSITSPGASTTTTLPTNQSQTLAAAQSKICNILEQFYDLFLYIASGIAALMIVIQGVLWVSSADDSKARKTAKTAIVHVIIGLIIVAISITLVNLALPEGSGCIATW